MGGLELMSKIPSYLAHMVGPGRMSDKVIPWDYPCLSISMVNIQNERAQIALDYTEVRTLPDHMRHLVGDIEVCSREKTHVVGGQVRRTRSPSVWVMTFTILDRERVKVVRGKEFAFKQVNGFVERFFSPVADDDIVIKL